MTDITAELDALPKMPVDRTYWSSNAHGHMEISGVYVEAIEARLALAERLLAELVSDGPNAYPLVKLRDYAGDYLAFRKSENG